ncbi:hypothetical protein [Streptomyces phaeolivaceus]|nr:hypothetical protein [Streptomyces phaeolivaceus]
MRTTVAPIRRTRAETGRTTPDEAIGAELARLRAEVRQLRTRGEGRR